MRLVVLGLLLISMLASCSSRADLPEGTTVSVRGHREGHVQADGELVPVVVTAEPRLGLCLAVGPTVDTSHWTAELIFGDIDSEEERSAPSVRMVSTLCFEGEVPSSVPEGPFDLCAEIHDEFDDTVFEPVCREVLRVDRAADFGALHDRRRALLRRLAELDGLTALAELEALADAAEKLEFPFFATSLRLVASYKLRRETAPLGPQRALQVLDRLPDWLDASAAARLSAQATLERVRIGEALGWPLEERWRALRSAEAKYIAVADPLRFTVAIQQTELLAEVGAIGRAREHLKGILAECERSPCDRRALPHAEGQLAWLILLDGEVGEVGLLEADGLLGRAIDALAADADSVEHANHRINRAYLAVRRRLDPGPELERVRLALAAVDESGRSRFLGRWADLVEALGMLEEKRPARAAELCSAVAAGAEQPSVGAWARSCLGAAYRQQGALELASEALDEALLLHELTTSDDLGQSLDLGPSRRADDYFEQARLALDRDLPREAWAVLERLDRISGGEGRRAGCGDSRETGSLTVRRSEVVEQLLRLELPAAGARRRQRESIRRALKEEAVELTRRLWSCGNQEPSEPPSIAATYRAFALQDEIIVMSRDESAEVKAVLRTPFDRRELLRLVEGIDERLAKRSATDREWTTALEPLTRALAPPNALSRPSGAQHPLAFALHGALQKVPLAALPLRASGSESRWLSDSASVHVLPAAAGRVRRPVPRADAALFVVDPLRNLPSGSASAELYRELFPEAKILFGDAATRDALRESLDSGGWLHLDAHGIYEAAFPELSYLELADGPIELAELLEWPMTGRLVNLAGCRTGSWPSSADSGRFGIAGLLASRGAGWVVATRGDISDEVAASFNGDFYQALATGADVPVAYSRALFAVQQRYRAVDWAALMLVRGAP